MNRSDWNFFGILGLFLLMLALAAYAYLKFEGVA